MALRGVFFGRCDVCFVPLGHDNGSLVWRVLGGEVKFLNNKKPKQWSSWGKLQGVFPSCLSGKGAGRVEIGNSGVKHLQLFIHDVMLGTQRLSMQLLQCSNSLGFARTGYLRITYLYTTYPPETDLNTRSRRQTLKQPPFFFEVPGKTLQSSRGSPGAGDERLKEAWSHAEEAVLLMLRCHLWSALSMGWNWDQNENPEKRSETFLHVLDSWLEDWKRKSYNLLWIVQSGRKQIEVNWAVLFQRRKQRLHSLKVIAVAWERKLSGEGVSGCLMSFFLQQKLEGRISLGILSWFQ